MLDPEHGRTMGDAGKLRGDRIAAWTAVFIVHMLLGWLLTRLPAPARDGAKMDSALDLVWIAAPRATPATAHPRARSASSGPPAKTSHPTPARRVRSAIPPALTVNEPATTHPLSAVFIQQAVERAAREPSGTFQPDPFANRTARLPGRAANTFRMRPSLSPAERLAQLGKLFGGGDDPCRSARDSINELSQAGDSRDLQNALDYEKRFCR